MSLSAGGLVLLRPLISMALAWELGRFEGLDSWMVIAWIGGSSLSYSRYVQLQQ